MARRRKNAFNQHLYNEKGRMLPDGLQYIDSCLSIARILILDFINRFSRHSKGILCEISYDINMVSWVQSLTFECNFDNWPRSGFKTSDRAEGTARADEKAQHRWEYVSILRRSATQRLGVGWGFETTSTQFATSLIRSNA